MIDSSSTLKFFARGLLLGAACVTLLASDVSETRAAWIGTQPANGRITSVTTQFFHNLYFTSITLSTTIPNCGANVTSAFIPKRYSNGTTINEQHDNAVSVAMAALLSGKNVHVWADMQTYTVLGKTTPVCILDQLTIDQ